MLQANSRQKRTTQKPIGVNVKAGHAKWVQTERAAHEEWAVLARTNSSASSLLHTLVARMENLNALVISREVLAELMCCSVATVKRAIKYLKENKWIQVVQIGGQGGANAYVVNSMVAWGQKRDQLPLATFTAQVVASAKEQAAEGEPTRLEHRQLHRIPMVVTREDLRPS